MKTQFLMLAASLALVPTTPVLAQATTQDRSSRALEAMNDMDRQDREWKATRGVTLTEAEKAVQAVTDALGRRDCAGAVSALNAGFAKAYPEVFMLAGSLYEEGVCVKQNWERAVSFYQRAAGVGHPGAAASLAAGYATVHGGRDKATSLWWALRAGTGLPAACSAVAGVAGDADRFVAALQAWPAGQLDACAYTGAVMASIQAEAEASAPSLAVALGLGGVMRVAFVPSTGQVQIVDALTEGALPTGVVSDSSTLAADRRTARRAFVATLQRRADRALQRYEKPATVPADWRAEAAHEFKAAR